MKASSQNTNYKSLSHFGHAGCLQHRFVAVVSRKCFYIGFGTGPIWGCGVFGLCNLGDLEAFYDETCVFDEWRLCALKFSVFLSLSKKLPGPV